MIIQFSPSETMTSVSDSLVQIVNVRDDTVSYVVLIRRASEAAYSHWCYSIPGVQVC